MPNQNPEQIARDNIDAQLSACGWVVPHGTVGRSKNEHTERPGWFLPIVQFISAGPPLRLQSLSTEKEKTWIYNWVDAKAEEISRRREGGDRCLPKTIAAPVQRFGRKSRNEACLNLSKSLIKNRPLLT